MGAYENVPDGHDNYENTDVYLWVRPVDFAAAFPIFREFAPGDGKVTRHYVFQDVFEREVNGRQPPNVPFFRVYDYKKTSAYDSGLPDPEAFWLSQQYVGLSVEWNGAAFHDKYYIADFVHWIYLAINEAIATTLATD